LTFNKKSFYLKLNYRFNNIILNYETMMTLDELKSLIVNQLQPLDPEKIILFGSYAHGNPTRDSDIDIYIVTKDDYIPHNFDEKMKLRLKAAYMLDSLRDKYPVDIIIHTRPMMKKFLDQNSSLCKEIFNKGITIL